MSEQTKKGGTTHVVTISSDKQFRQMVENTFSSQLQISLDMLESDLTQIDETPLEGAAVVIVDLDASNEAQVASLARMTSKPSDGHAFWCSTRIPARIGSLQPRTPGKPSTWKSEFEHWPQPQSSPRGRWYLKLRDSTRRPDA